MIRIQGLSLSLEGRQILEDINLEIKKGDFLAIIGPNGGGKSTLIRCLLGFIRPQRGEITLWGKPLSKFRDWHLIGYVPQRAGKDLNQLFPLTVKEFITLPFRWYKKRLDSKGIPAFAEMTEKSMGDEKKPNSEEIPAFAGMTGNSAGDKKEIDTPYVDGLLETFGLREMLHKKLYQLSFGQLQRAYLVRALVLKPEVLILDEPSVGLDFINQQAFYEILSHFHSQGLTIVLITHETWLLTRGVTKVACLNQRLYFHGEHAEFCVLAETEKAGFDFHRIEHSHW